MLKTLEIRFTLYLERNLAVPFGLVFLVFDCSFKPGYAWSLLSNGYFWLKPHAGQAQGVKH